MKAGVNVKSVKVNQVLPMVAAVFALLALWFAFSGWQVWSANSLMKASEEARKKVAGEVQPLISGLAGKAGTLSSRSDIAAAILAGNDDAAKALVMQAVPGTEAVDFVPAGFAAAYSNPEAFGFGKLALLERAS